MSYQFFTLQECQNIYRCIKRDENTLKKLGMSQQCDLEAKAAGSMQGYIKRTAVSIPRNPNNSMILFQVFILEKGRLIIIVMKLRKGN